MEDKKSIMDKTIPEIKNPWIRRPFAAIITVILFVIIFLYDILKGFCEATSESYYFFIECWKGKN